MAVAHLLSVINDHTWKKVVLDVGPLNTRSTPNEGPHVKMRRRSWT